MNFFSNKTHFKVSIFIHRLSLKQEEEQRKKADMLSEEIREQLRRKEEQCSKETELKQQLELTVEGLQGELKAVRDRLNQVN